MACANAPVFLTLGAQMTESYDDGHGGTTVKWLDVKWAHNADRVITEFPYSSPSDKSKCPVRIDTEHTASNRFGDTVTGESCDGRNCL